MRVSGNIFERLVIKILPLCLAFGLIVFLTMEKTIAQFIKPFGGSVMILWLFDSLTILTKQTKRLTIDGNFVILGQDKILPDDIINVIPRKDKRIGTDIKTIEIEYLKNGLLKKQNVITKPTFLDVFGKKFKTLDLLVDRFPSLRDRIMDEQEY